MVVKAWSWYFYSLNGTRLTQKMYLLLVQMYYRVFNKKLALQSGNIGISLTNSRLASTNSRFYRLLPTGVLDSFS